MTDQSPIEGSLVKERLTWLGYGLITGIIIGVLVGWLWHGVIGSALRVILIVLLITPFVVAYVFYLRSKDAEPTAQHPAPPQAPSLPTPPPNAPIDAASRVVADSIDPDRV